MEKRKNPESEERRKYLKTVGALVAGLAIGGAAGWLSKPVERVEVPGVTVTERITETLTKTVTAPITPTPAKVTLRLLDSDEPHGTCLKEVAKIYEEKTGVKVIVDLYPYASAYEKAILNLSTHTGAYDLVCWDCIWKGELAKGGWLQPLDSYIADPTLPDLNWESFAPGSVELYGTWGGKKYGINMHYCSVALAYRKDLFEEYGIGRPPKNWGEYLEIAKQLTLDTDGDGKIDIYGCMLHQGEQDSSVVDWQTRLQGFKRHPELGDVDLMFDDKMRTVFDRTGNGLKALELILEQMPYSPPDVLAIDYATSASLFRDGKVAMYITPHGVIFGFEDPKISKVAGKVGYAAPPYSEPEPNLYVGGWYMSVAKDSKNPVEAYKFMAWIASDEGQTAMLEAGSESPYLRWAHEDPKWIERYPVIASFEELAKYNPLPYPTFPEYMEVQRAWYEQITLAVAGEKTSEEAIETMVQETTDILTRAGYY